MADDGAAHTVSGGERPVRLTMVLPTHSVHCQCSPQSPESRQAATSTIAWCDRQRGSAAS